MSMKSELFFKAIYLLEAVLMYESTLEENKCP